MGTFIAMLVGPIVSVVSLIAFGACLYGLALVILSLRKPSPTKQHASH